MSPEKVNDSSERVRDHLDKGHTCCKNRDYQTAIDYYELALRLDPDNEEAHEGCETALREQAMSRLRPWNKWVYQLLGTVYLSFGMHRKAIHYFGALSAANPANGLLAKQLGRALEMSGSKARAMRTYTRALKVRSEDKQLLRWAARLAGELDDKQTCSEMWMALSRLSPNDAAIARETKNAQAAYYQEKAKIDELRKARADRDKQTVMSETAEAKSAQIKELVAQYQSSPDNPESLQLLVKAGGLLFEIGRAEQAISVLESVLDKQPGHREALLQLADHHRHAEEYPEAIARYLELLEYQGDFVEWQVAIAEMELEMAQEALAREPDSEDLQIVYEEAKQDLDQVYVRRARENLARNPGDSEYEVELARRLRVMGQNEEAISLLQHAMQSPSRKFIATKLLGETYLAIGNYALAEETLQLALESAPPTKGALSADLKEIYYRLGEVHEGVAEQHLQNQDFIDQQEALQRALSQYKRVYQADIRFMDIKKRYEGLVERLHSKGSGSKPASS